MGKRAKWSMLWIYLINIVLVLVLAGNASAVSAWDAGGGGDKLWSNGNNWNPDGVPTSAVAAVIDNPPNADCLIDATVDACCANLDVGLNNETCYLTMTGGTLRPSGTFSVGHTGLAGAHATGVFNMTGGAIETKGQRLWVGYGTGSVNNDATEDDSFGTFTMTTGCDVNIGTKIELGKNNTGVGEIDVSGGTLRVGHNAGNEDFEIGKYGTGILNIYGGDINCADRIKMSESGGTTTVYMTDGNLSGNYIEMKGGHPTIYLAGGLIIVNQLDMSGDNAKLDINQGEVRVEIDTQWANVQSYLNAQKIIGYHGEGYVIATPAGGGIGYIRIVASPSDPNLASGPSPGNYTTVDWTPAGPTLSWTPGTYDGDVADGNVTNHDVYFGTVFADVNDANRDNTRGVLLSQNQDACSVAFPSPPPVLGQTYYWRIDEVNDACAPDFEIRKGVVWQFKMAAYEVVEDFESYANTIALTNVWALTGSTITLDKTIFNSGTASMKYAYDNNTAPPHYTEASANTTGANKLPVDINDWTTVDIQALVLYFYGDAGNSIEKMYVALKDTANKTAVIYYDNPNDLSVPTWHEWNIKLSDFNDINGVNLHSVATVYVGFGDRVNPAAGYAGIGTVYFDDIRLYPRRCRASLAPLGDISGPTSGTKDCTVDFYDVNLVKRDWLKPDYNGVGRDGVLKGGASWVNDAIRGRCVRLDGVTGWIDINDDDFSNFHNKTIAFWVKVENYPATYPYLFYFSDGNSTNPYRIYFQTYTPASWYVRVRFVDTYSPDAYTAGLDSWTHLAFVLQDTPDGKCNGLFYADGGLIDTITGKPRHSGAAVGVNIGSESDGKGNEVNAVFDDFRVYDYALSAAEISALYNATLKPGGSGTPPEANELLRYDFNEVAGTVAHNSSTYVYYHPLNSPAELYAGEAQGSRIVNFRDFALLAGNWLKEQLWP